MAEPKATAEHAETSTGNAPDEAAVRQRAYEISQREDAGSAAENWRRAEAELRDAPDADGQADADGQG